MNMIDRCFGLHTRDRPWKGLCGLLWAKRKKIINGGKQKLLSALHQDSHTNQKQKIAGHVSVQVERQGGQRGPRGQPVIRRPVSMLKAKHTRTAG